jgi:Domain of unknown function (DUF4389)
MSYPVAFEVDYAERRSRLTALLRLILAIPLAIWSYFYGVAAYCGVVIAWFAIVITGRYPEGLYNFVAGYTRLLARTTAYAVLLCDRYPSFGGSDDPSYPVRMHFAGPLPRYSRWKTLFRGVLAIPIWILRYATNLLLEIAAFAAWLVIVVTGKLPRGLFEVLEFAVSYAARSDAYLFLLTETYPPFEEAQTPFVGIDPQPLSGSGQVI